MTHLIISLIVERLLAVAVEIVDTVMVADWYVRTAFFVHRYRGTRWEEKIV